MLVIEPQHPVSRDAEFLDWLREHGIEPTVTYKLEIFGESVRAYQYAVDDEGRKFVIRDEGDMARAHEPVFGEPALRAPFTVDLRRPPPKLGMTAVRV